MSKIARATVVGQGIRQGAHDQTPLSLIDHDPVFVVKRHGRDLALMMALSDPQWAHDRARIRADAGGCDGCAFAKSWRREPTAG
jgi:hypothetical protein